MFLHYFFAALAGYHLVVSQPSVGKTCLLSPIPGNCRAFLPSFYFNSSVGFCDCFVYTGCDGNENRFDTMQECMGSCVVPSNQQILTPACRNLFKGTSILENLLKDLDQPQVDVVDKPQVDAVDKPKVNVIDQPPKRIQTISESFQNFIPENPQILIPQRPQTPQNSVSGGSQNSFPENSQITNPEKNQIFIPGTSETHISGIPQNSAPEKSQTLNPEKIQIDIPSRSQIDNSTPEKGASVEPFVISFEAHSPSIFPVAPTPIQPIVSSRVGSPVTSSKIIPQHFSAAKHAWQKN